MHHLNSSVCARRLRPLFDVNITFTSGPFEKWIKENLVSVWNDDRASCLHNLELYFSNLIKQFHFFCFAAVGSDWCDHRPQNSTACADRQLNMLDRKDEKTTNRLDCSTASMLHSSDHISCRITDREPVPVAVDQKCTELCCRRVTQNGKLFC